MNGIGTAKNRDKAVEWYQLAAQQGYQSSIDKLEELGQSVPSQTVRLNDLMSAAEAGDAESQCRLGELYYHGNGVEQNDAEAFRLFSLAAQQGLASAQYDLGILYHQGRGVAQNNEEAFHLFLASAEQNYADAQFALGTFYGQGQVVEQNAHEALTWYLKAAEQGHARAQYMVGMLLLQEAKGDDAVKKEAFDWCVKSARQGDMEAQFIVGELYNKGIGVARDTEKALAWYLKSADQGYEAAALALQHFSQNHTEGIFDERVARFVKINSDGDAHVRREPDVRSDSLGVATANATYRWLETAPNGWHKIQLNEEVVGYVSGSLSTLMEY